VTKVKAWDDLSAAVGTARAYDPKVVVEQAVVGREIECGVLEADDGSGLETSVCGEIRVTGGHEFYDFAAKYLDTEGSTELDVPADLPPDVVLAVQDLAVRAFRAARLRGVRPRRLLRHRRGRRRRQRAEHDPGLHPGVDVPAAVGGERGALPRAGEAGSCGRPSGSVRACADGAGCSVPQPGGAAAGTRATAAARAVSVPASGA